MSDSRLSSLTRWRPPRPRLPAPVNERLATLRRDFLALTDAFRRDGLPPFHPKDGAAYAHRTGARAGESLQRRALTVIGVDRLTPDAVCVRLSADGLPFTFRPGQFLTLCVSIGGVEHRRAYSLCSDPALTDAVAVGVKRVAGGRVSNWLNDHLAEGDVVDVLGPSGSYGVTVRPNASRHVALVSGGSGITPNLAIARAVLAGEPASRVTLVYANRSAADVMFRDTLSGLLAAWPRRFILQEILEAPPEGWTGRAGRITPADLDFEADTWCVCGPTPMMEAVTAALADRGVPADRVRVERFTPAPRATGAPADPQPMIVSVGRTQIACTVEPGQTLLEAGLGAGAPMPYSCAMGGCGACRVRLPKGAVTMDTPNCLTAREQAEGYILACVARPSCPVTVELPK